MLIWDMPGFYPDRWGAKVWTSRWVGRDRLRVERVDAGTLPDLKALTACFTPDPTRLPEITVATVSLSTYEVLLDGMTNVSTAAFV